MKAQLKVSHARSFGSDCVLPRSTKAHRARRVGWGVADQAISSAANFFLGIVTARELGPAGFGAFSLAFIAFAFLISAARGPSTDPLLVRYSGSMTRDWHRAVGASSGTSIVLGLIGGSTCVIIGVALPHPLSFAFLALGVWLPVVLLQDSYRFAFFSCGRGELACVNDMVWGVLQALGVMGLVMTGSLTPFTAMFVFGATAALAAALGWWQIGIAPDLARVRSWLIEHRALGTRYLIENVSLGGGRQLRLTFIGFLTGLGAVGSIRAAEMLLGPFLTLLAGVSQVAVPEARLMLEGGTRALVRFCLWLSAAQAAVVGFCGLLELVILRHGLGRLLLAGLWGPTRHLLAPTLGGVIVLCVQNSCAAGVRALGNARRSLIAQLGSAFLAAAFSVVGAVIDGAVGSCWGLASGTALGVLVWWWQLDRALHEDKLTKGRLRGSK
jgi:O-antigen/teichoic acid export membrane protein